MLSALTVALLLAPPAGTHLGLQAAAHAGLPSFPAGRPVLGTYFFYWYHDGTRAHFLNGDGSDALTTHPAPTEDVPYRYDSVDWWRTQLALVREAGLDFIAPVYWGYPGTEHWSNVGIRTLARLAEQQHAAGEPVMPVAMFYDTSTLAHNSDGYHVALDTERGKVWFYETIRDFWSLLPPYAWARIDGRPLIFLYSANFAETQDPGIFEDLRQRFTAEFGVAPHVVKESSWRGDADDVYSWGGALGLRMGTVAALGPGYDHSAVPGRRPLIVDRREGEFYRENWSRLLARSPATRPYLAMVETWNEFHEGTDIAPSVEYGRQYVELTKEYAAKWHAGEQLPRPGRFGTAQSVRWQAGGGDGGLTLPDRADGLTAAVEQAGVPAVSTRANEYGGRYLYADIDWSFLYDEAAPPVTVTVTFWDTGCDEVIFEYDSMDPAGSVRAGAFKAGGRVTLGGQAAWRTETFRVEDARFGDRTNGADFRFAVLGGDLVVREVSVSKRR